MNQIQKVSSYFVKIFNSLILMMPLWIAYPWILNGHPKITGFIMTSVSFGEKLSKLDKDNLIHPIWDASSKIIGFSAQIISSLPTLLSFIVLRAIFKNYQRNQIFISSNAIYCKYLGYIFIMKALITEPISNALMGLARTFGYGPGNRMVILAFGTNTVQNLFYGAIIIVISWVMLEASKINEEQKFII